MTSQRITTTVMNDWNSTLRIYPSVAIYGSGKYTRRLIEHIPHADRKRLLIWEDNPRATELEGIPVILRPAGFTPDIAAIVLGTDTFQKRMLANLGSMHGNPPPCMEMRIPDVMLTKWRELSSDTTELVIYGAGKFTAWFVAELEKSKLALPSVIWDDNPQTDSMNGVKVIRTPVSLPENIGGIILGTDTFQREMRNRLECMPWPQIPIIELAPRTEIQPESKPLNSPRHPEGYLDAPNTMHLNLTNVCNLRCRICRTENPQPYYLSHALLEKIIAESFDNLTNLRIDSAGEHLLSSELPFVLGEAAKRQLPVFMSTNGALMTREKAEMICSSSVNCMQVSLDSPVKETLEFIRRGARFESVIEGIHNIVEARRSRNQNKPEIHLHAGVFGQNLEQLPGLFALAKKLGVDGVTYCYGFIHDFMDPDWSVYWCREKTDTIETQLQALSAELGLFFSRPKRFDAAPEQSNAGKYCDYLFEKVYIDPSGSIFPCCIGRFDMGNLHDKTLREIWHGARYRQLRKTYNTTEPLWPKCASCYMSQGWEPNNYKVHFAPEHWDYVERRIKESRNG